MIVKPLNEIELIPDSFIEKLENKEMVLFFRERIVKLKEITKKCPLVEKSLNLNRRLMALMAGVTVEI